MEFTAITYSKVFSLGNYENEKIGVEVKLTSEDNPVLAMKEAKQFVEFMSTDKQRKIELALDVIKQAKQHHQETVNKAKTLVKEAK